jgi:hypothetical protein
VLFALFLVGWGLSLVWGRLPSGLGASRLPRSQSPPSLRAGGYATTVRATAFAFSTLFGRFIGAGANFGIAALVTRMGTLGKPVALTAIAFGIGLLFIPFA